MHPVTDSIITATPYWKPAAADEWILQRWRDIPSHLSEGAAIFGIAEPLRKVPLRMHLRNETLRHGTRALAEWSHDRTLEEILDAQREYSMVINDRAEPGDRITHERYRGLRMDVFARAFQESGLEMAAFGSTPATLDARLVLPTDDADFIGDLRGQWDKFCDFSRILGGRFTWASNDPTVDRFKIAKVPQATWAGLIDCYDETSVLRAYRTRRFNGMYFPDALEQRTSIDVYGTPVESLPLKAALICTGCVGRRPKDKLRAKFIDYQQKAHDEISRARQVARPGPQLVAAAEAPSLGVSLAPVR